MDAIGFGALNLDKVFLVNEIPGAEEESYVLDLKIYPGGSSANTIVALSRLGLKTGFIGKVGDDEEGRYIINDLRMEGVDLRNVLVEKGRTGCAMIFVDKKGNRAILVDPGVNDTIKFNEIDLDYVKKFRLLHLSSFICKVYDSSFKSQKKLVEAFDGIISFDPGSVYAKKGLKYIMPILEKVDIFMPNEKEIELLTNLNYREGAKFMIDMGIKVVVIKRGVRGCYITNGKEEFEIPALNVKVLDTTGAGDAFNAGFLYGYLKGKDLKKCGELGNYIAALCIQKFGAREGLPYKTSLRKFCPSQ